MMTKEMLTAMRNMHKEDGKTAMEGSYHSGWSYGYAYALDYILDHWDDIYQEHRFESAVEDAKEYLRDYVVNEYEYNLLVLSNLPEKIARTFLDNYDPNVAASDQYDRAITQYDSMIEEKLNSLPIHKRKKEAFNGNSDLHRSADKMRQRLLCKKER